MNARHVFLCGPFEDDSLRATVLGRDVALQVAAGLHGYALHMDGDGAVGLFAASGQTTAGWICEITGPEHDRLAFYAAVMGYAAIEGHFPGYAQPVVTYGDILAKGASWDLAIWRVGYGPLARAVAVEVMAWSGQIAPDLLRARRPSIRVRAASRLRAAKAAPSSLRQSPDAQAVEIAALRQPYAMFFAVEEYDLTVRRFDGAEPHRMTRAVFVSGDAVTVLPYDPVRDRVLLIEQFRAGPFGRGDPAPWQLEAIAGRIDPGETPEQAARREAIEEAGLTLGRFWPVASYYPSPGAKTEFLYSYVAEADLPDGTAGIHGLAEETEDIKSHLVSFDDLMTLVASGEVGNAPVILTALWLERERVRLRGG